MVSSRFEFSLIFRTPSELKLGTTNHVTPTSTGSLHSLRDLAKVEVSYLRVIGSSLIIS
jgi:hypothetical protein